MFDAECICGLDGDFDPMPYCRRYYTARQSHICCECGEEIKPGDKFELVNGCWDGHWSCYKTCTPCMNIANQLFPCGHVHGRLRRDLKEHFGIDFLTEPPEEEDV